MTTPLRLDVRPSGAGGEGEFELLLDVPSDLHYVGPAVDLVAERCRHGPLPPRKVQFNLRTALAEALANAIAYGNRQDPSRLVRVRVEASRDGVRIHVTDDGVGFDPAAAAPDGYGISGMRRRLRGVNGTLEVESTPGEGTAVNASVPA